MNKIIIWLNLVLFSVVSPLASATEIYAPPMEKEAAETFIIARPPRAERIRRDRYYYRQGVRPRQPTVINRTIVVNPRRAGSYAWAWNGGRRWYVRSSYWGGGFWGGFVIGAVTGGIIDAITGNQGDRYVENNYYTVEKDSPGYTLLSDYELVQTPCDSRKNDLVVINGPENSQICAFSNDIVSSGVYSVNVSNLTLVPDS